jgi:hypothetical protein
MRELLDTKRVGKAVRRGRGRVPLGRWRNAAVEQIGMKVGSRRHGFVPDVKLGNFATLLRAPIGAPAAGFRVRVGFR